MKYIVFSTVKADIIEYYLKTKFSPKKIQNQLITLLKLKD